MFRFTIRDVLWLMVAVGLAICLYRDRYVVRELGAEMRRAQTALRELDFKNGRLMETIAKQKVELERQEVESE